MDQLARLTVIVIDKIAMMMQEIVSNAQFRHLSQDVLKNVVSVEIVDVFAEAIQKEMLSECAHSNASTHAEELVKRRLRVLKDLDQST
jgi:hypothetical protein